jgi:hypothetical protein
MPLKQFPEQITRASSGTGEVWPQNAQGKLCAPFIWGAESFFGERRHGGLADWFCKPDGFLKTAVHRFLVLARRKTCRFSLFLDETLTD